MPIELPVVSAHKGMALARDRLGLFHRQELEAKVAPGFQGHTRLTTHQVQRRSPQWICFPSLRCAIAVRLEQLRRGAPNQLAPQGLQITHGCVRGFVELRLLRFGELPQLVPARIEPVPLIGSVNLMRSRMRLRLPWQPEPPGDVALATQWRALARCVPSWQHVQVVQPAFQVPGRALRQFERSVEH